MKEKKRFLSEEEFLDGKLCLTFWLWFLPYTLFVLYNIFFVDSNTFEDLLVVSKIPEYYNLYFVLWTLIFAILLLVISSLLFWFLTIGLECLFARFWVNYHKVNDKKYSEAKIERSLYQRRCFFIFSVIIYVLSLLFVIFFSGTVREIKNISEVCWIGYHESYWITKLPKKIKNLVLESCAENQEYQNLSNQ